MRVILEHLSGVAWATGSLALVVAILGTSVTGRAASDSPDTTVAHQIERFVRHANRDAPGPVSISIRRRPTTDRSCHQPQPEFTGSGHRTTGLLTIAVTCQSSKRRRRYYQVKVSVTADYWIASRQLPANQTVTVDMLTQKRGPITDLNGPLLLKREAIVGQVTRRRVSKGTPINKRMVAPPKVIKRGDDVTVRISGNGFEITTHGTALGSATRGESVRVKTRRAHVVTGTTDKKGRVIVH